MASNSFRSPTGEHHADCSNSGQTTDRCSSGQVVLVWGTRLLLFNLAMIPLVSLATYFPGLDLAASGLFLVLTASMARRLTLETSPSLLTAALIGLLAQSPGIVLTLASCHSFHGLNTVFFYWPFFLQAWHTPFLPLLSCFPQALAGGISLAYRAYYYLSGCYVLFIVAVVALTRNRGH